MQWAPYLLPHSPFASLQEYLSPKSAPILYWEWFFPNADLGEMGSCDHGVGAGLARPMGSWQRGKTHQLLADNDVAGQWWQEVRVLYGERAPINSPASGKEQAAP